MSNFKHGICGCTDDVSMCLLGWCVPCYAWGKVAESVGENCLLYGILTLTPLQICSGTIIRGKLREKYGIEGSLVGDALTHWCCACCAGIQEIQEVADRGDAPAGTIIMSRT